MFPLGLDADLAALMTRERMYNPDHPRYVHPETGERVCVPITTEYASVYLEWGLDAAEYHANWGV